MKYKPKILWTSMKQKDLERVNMMSDLFHPDFPESNNIFENRLELYPQGCFVLKENKSIIGYCISHPWNSVKPPTLNLLLKEISTKKDGYFIHDIGIKPEYRGQKYLKNIVSTIENFAKEEKYNFLNLVSVNKTSPIWVSLGFVSQNNIENQKYIQERYNINAQIMEKFLQN